VKTTRFLVSTFLAALATLFFESSRIPLLPRVDWFLIAVAYQSTSGDFSASTLGGAAAGLAEDILLHPVRGANAFSKALLGFLLTLVSVRLVFAGTIVVAVALAVSTALDVVIVNLLGKLILKTPFFFGFEDTAGAVLTGAVGGLLYLGWRFPWKEEWRRHQRRRLR
jgi:rod shape-determining protein MreD